MTRPRYSLLKALKQELPSGARLLVAVSGGIDSCALLHGCRAVAGLKQLDLGVAHLDHALRPLSEADAAFVAQLSASYGLPFYLERATPPRRGNLEAWGREQRYRFFDQIRQRHTFDWILTAHNANDAAETLLMRLLANKEPGVVLRVDERRRCRRPLLDVTRAEISSYAQRHQLSFREDPSNRDNALLRNRVRNVLVPLLEKNFDPRIIEVLAQRSAALAADQEGLEALAAQIRQKLSAWDFGSRAWLKAARAELIRLDPSLQWRVAEGLILDRQGFKLGRQRSADLAAFLLGNAVAIDLRSGLRLRRRHGTIVTD